VEKVERERAFRIGDHLSKLAYRHPRIRKTAEENLRFTGFPQSIGYESLKSFTRCCIDFFRLRTYSLDYLMELFQHPSPEHIPEEGAILLTAHIGNWELMGALFSALSGGRLSVVAKPLKNRRVDALINSIRRHWNVKVVPTGARTAVLHELVRGRYVGILLDQRPKVKDGVLTTFLGRKTYTHKGVAVLSLKTGKPVVPAFCIVEGLRYRVKLFKPIYPEGSVEELTQKYTSAIDSVVREHPEQWFWFHRRWKNSPEFLRWRELEKTA